MKAYAAWWAAGGGLGALSALRLLRGREMPLQRAVSLIVAALAAFFVGAKLQSLLEELPLADALGSLPARLLEPGLRLPLGLLFGLASLIISAKALGVAWGLAADALALCAAVATFVGRFGCFSNGCCSGRICQGALQGWWCVRYPPVTEPYGLQAMNGVLEPTAALSLPVHPLQLYFAAAELLALVLMIWLRKRQAPDGSALLAYCAISASSRLLLEPLRAAPAGSLVFWIPALVLVVLGCLGMVAVWRYLMTTAPKSQSAPSTR